MKRRRMMCDHELGYYDTYEATDSLSLEEMIESDMRQQQNHDCDDATAINNNQNHNSHNHSNQHQAQPSQLWVHCAHTSSDASIDFDTSVLLVNPQTGTPVLHAHSPNDSHHAYILVNPDMMENNVESPNLAKESRQHTRFVSTSSSSSSSTSSSSSEDEDTAAEDGEEVRPGEHVLHLHSTVGLTTSVKHYPKPIYSYSCLIAMALKNSETGCLPVSEIYNFMIRNYPYFKTAPNGWKNSVRHNLSLNKCFAKVDKPSGKQRKGCLWTMNPDRIEKMDDEVFKWSQKDPVGIQQSMAKPEDFGVLEKFCDKHERQMEDIRLELANPTVNHVKTVHNTPSIQQQQQKTVELPEVEPMKEEVESEVNLDNSLLDSTYHVDFWGELEEKLEFDIPLTLEHHLPTTCNQPRTVKVKL